MTDHTLRTQRDGGIVRVTLDNPPVNALSARMMQELRELLLELRADDTVSVIVFDSANPEFFIAHVDMNLGEQMDLLNDLASRAPEGVNVFQSVGELLRTQPQVTIVQLAGIARGGGAEFVAAADMTFAARETARIGQIETLMGIVPSGGGTQYLAERVGRHRALELVLLADAVDADTAAAFGWINRALPADDLDGYVETAARRIAALPEGVAAAAKRVLAPVTPVQGYAREQSEWQELIDRPATVRLMTESLRRGAQTPSGERDLEALLRAIGRESSTPAPFGSTTPQEADR
jgi:enoyl-CoA hydratase/carnithine racemase